MDEWDDESIDDWQPPVICPECFSDETYLEGMQFECSVFICERCGYRFEIDQG